MSELVSQGSKYSDEDRRKAATLYAIHGSLAKVEKLTGIPDSTVSDWLKTDWFIGLVGELRSQRQDEHIARYHAIASKALDKAEKGIDKLTIKGLSASDIKSLVVTGATSTDKALLLDGKPTTITNKGSDKALTDQLRELSRSLKARDMGVVSIQDKKPDT